MKALLAMLVSYEIWALTWVYAFLVMDGAGRRFAVRRVLRCGINRGIWRSGRGDLLAWVGCRPAATRVKFRGGGLVAFGRPVGTSGGVRCLVDRGSRD